MKTILCPAIHLNNGELWKHQPKNIQNGFVICGHRHHNCFSIFFGMFGESWMEKKKYIVQGFLTSDNQFVSRQDAAKIALASGQIKEEIAELFSEDLY